MTVGQNSLLAKRACGDILFITGVVWPNEFFFLFIKKKNANLLFISSWSWSYSTLVLVSDYFVQISLSFERTFGRGNRMRFEFQSLWNAVWPNDAQDERCRFAVIDLTVRFSLWMACLVNLSLTSSRLL